MSVIENPDNFGPLDLPKSVHNLIDIDDALGKCQESSGDLKALVIINRPITCTFELFSRLWHQSEFVVCADGGANRLYDYAEKHNLLHSFIPKLIIGDLDSLKESVRLHYRSNNVLIKKQDTQYATDFSKSVCAIKLLCSGFEQQLADVQSEHDGVLQLTEELAKLSKLSKERLIIISLGGIGGRFDHSIQLVSQLYKYHVKEPQIRFVLVNNSDVVFLVPKGSNFIKYSSTGNNCGILPLYGKAIISTQGLKWDVRDWDTSMKENVSSSNRLVDKQYFNIDTDESLCVNIET